MSYQKFIIITYPRSGTHMLRTALASHPNVVCHGEMFNPNKGDHPYDTELEVENILRHWVFNRQPTEIKTVGFVHHAYHPGTQTAWPDNRSNPKWQTLWPLLQQIPNLKVIHLRRENLLCRHLSQRMANQTGHWQTYTSQQQATAEGKPYMINPKHKPSIYIDAQQLQQDFDETLHYRQWVADYLADKTVLELSYEQLCDDLNKSIDAVTKLLGIPNLPLQPSLKKLEHRSLSAAIENYIELKQHFIDSQYACFFNE